MARASRASDFEPQDRSRPSRRMEDPAPRCQFRTRANSGNRQETLCRYNGIVEVTGSTPAGSTNRTRAKSINWLSLLLSQARGWMWFVFHVFAAAAVAASVSLVASLIFRLDLAILDANQRPEERRARRPRPRRIMSSRVWCRSHKAPRVQRTLCVE